MSHRRRAATGLLALALAGGALGAAVAHPVGAVGAALASAPTDASLSLPASPAASLSAAAAVEPPGSALTLAQSLLPVANAAPAAAAPASGSRPGSSSSTSSLAAPPVPPAERDGFARSLAIPAGADGSEDADGVGGAGDSAGSAAAAPVSVAVARIGVDTPLVSLGIAADGSLEVPGRDEFDRAGWLTTSAVPGDPGASVIAGHVDSTTGPAVFFRLHELVAGDEVVVTRGDGSTATFVVDAVQRVSKDAFPTAEVYGPQPGPVLRLITCGGTFDRSTGHYEDNVIAFASLR